MKEEKKIEEKWSREQWNSNRRKNGIVPEQLFSLWHSENFAIPAKFSLCHIFAMIAKIHYHSESYCV